MTNNIYDQISITVDGKGPFKYKKGISLEEIINSFEIKDRPLIVAALVDNELRELNFILNEDAKIELINITSAIGTRIYQRSLSFIFIRACMELFPGSKIFIEHSLSKGLYSKIEYTRDITPRDVGKISERMREIIDEDVKFIKERVPLDEAQKIFQEYEQIGKVNLLKYRIKEYVNIYQCGWLKNYFYGYMVPSTGYIKEYKLQYYGKGVILQYPRAEDGCKIPKFEEHPKIFKVFREAEEWGKILEIGYVADLNDMIVNSKESEFIRIAEALHEKKIAKLADSIKAEVDKRRVILIAGPSSSGKTTFAQRLMIQLRVNGIRPVAISLDDYFVNRKDTPLDENGEYDFESLYAIDLDLFNSDLRRILQGEKVEIPNFNFRKGIREYNGHKIQIDSNQPIILEGIHALNDELTSAIPNEEKYKIYISPITQLNIDEQNRIPTTDARLIRRIVRDSKFRSNNAEKTLSMWDSVRRGEERNIFPFQEEADFIFNSALIYELSVLKKYALPLLEEVENTSSYFAEAKRLLKFLNYFVPLKREDEIPRTSILREFIGGSSFHEEILDFDK